MHLELDSVPEKPSCCHCEQMQTMHPSQQNALVEVLAVEQVMEGSLGNVGYDYIVLLEIVREKDKMSGWKDDFAVCAYVVALE